MIPQIFLIALLALPAAAVLILGLPAWFGFEPREQTIARTISLAFIGVILAALGLWGWMLTMGTPQVEASLGTWFQIGHYRFEWTLVGDRLSIPFALFCGALVGLIGVFSRRYLHQEAGYFRFYLLLAMFGASVELVVLAGSLDLLFFGWEIVGLSSALLIAFFHERRRPVEHGLRAFITYRVCDIGLLAAAVWMHHTIGNSTTVPGAASLPWEGFPVPTQWVDQLLIGFLLLWASMGKSAQIPMGGWLPRAMEGPTPSSAIFYGAISIHLGPYLLLRAAPLLHAVPLVSAGVVVVGGLTALHGTFVGRVQTDIKSALGYASMTQVGIIFVEIGLGFHYLAIVHIVGHASFRSLQILRSPSLLHDHHHLEQAMGKQLPRTGGHLERWVPTRLQPWLYRHALERGYFDAFLIDHLVGGFVRVFRRLDALDRAWTNWLAGEALGDEESRR